MCLNNGLYFTNVIQYRQFINFFIAKKPASMLRSTYRYLVKFSKCAKITKNLFQSPKNMGPYTYQFLQALPFGLHFFVKIGKFVVPYLRVASRQPFFDKHWKVQNAIFFIVKKAKDNPTYPSIPYSFGRQLQTTTSGDVSILVSLPMKGNHACRRPVVKRSEKNHDRQR